MGGLHIEGLFLQVLNMSISASWLIGVVLVLRVLLQKVKAPKGISYVLWAFAAVRLLCPFSLESSWSLLPSGQTFSEEFLYEANPKISSGITFIDKIMNDFLAQTYVSSENGNVAIENDMGSGNSNAITENGMGSGNSNAITENSMENGNSNAVTENSRGNGDSNAVIENSTGSENGDTITESGTGAENGNTVQESGIGIGTEISDAVCGTTATGKYPVQNFLYFFSVLWGAGVAGMLFYSVMSYYKLKKTVDVSMHLRDNLWICDAIQSPFILGMREPRIYLPSHIAKEQVPYIIAHEMEHLKYRDHWWKLLGFGILAVHWFNPLVWIAYICMCRDIELACDERVICRMNNAEKKKYTESLLLCSSPRHLISACPVAFGEIGIKERIKSVITYKKPAAWLVGAAVMLCIVVAVCFLTNPAKKITFETWTSSITSDDISWSKVSKNYEKETVSGQISEEEYEGLCEVLGTITNEDCFVKDEIRDFQDKYTLVLSRTNQTWKFFCLEDGMVGLEFEDDETASDFGCEGQFMVIESKALWDYIVNVAEVHRVAELTPTKAFGYLFGDRFTKMMVNSHYYDTECACAITKNNRVVMHLSSYFQNYEWERVENPVISSTDEWVRFESTADAAEIIFWNEGEGIIECKLPNYGDGSPIYWQAKQKENVEMSNSFFANAWKLCLDECIMNGYTKNHNAESLTKLIGLINLEELFADYDGNTICHHFVDNTVGTMQRDDIVYYRTEETDMQKIVQTMFSVMLDALLEPSENRPYTVTQYRLDEMEIIQGSENIWFIPFVKGAYKYDGVDLVTFEEQLPYTTVYEDGLIPFFGQGSDSMFYYILIRHEGVYRLERGGKFTSKYDYLLNMEKLEETEEYISERERVAYVSEVGFMDCYYPNEEAERPYTITNTA